MTNQAAYFTPTIGVSLPLYGQKFSEQDAIDRAHLAAILAKINYDDQKRQFLSNLRQNYVTLWESDREALIDQTFVTEQSSLTAPARSLVRTGFWTTSSYLDFDREISQARSDLSSSKRRERAQYATISAILAKPIAQFEPVDPNLASGCFPNSERAAASAVAADPLLAQYDAQIVLAQRELTRVKRSSLNASALANIGADYNILHNFGYVVQVGVALTWPRHARAEERALYDQLTATLEQNALLEKQRRSDLRGLTEQAIADLGVARDTFAQAQVDTRAKAETLREAIVRRNTVATGGAKGFEDVQKARSDLYASQRTVVQSQAAIWTKAADLLTLAPETCVK
ncbi:MAG: hypothetical protein NVS9B12_11500 [Vulcanimicrobiaceae bacterium]